MHPELQNRRQCERVRFSPAYTEVLVHRIVNGRMESVEGHLCDLSERGLRIDLDARLDLGEVVNIDLVVPGSAIPGVDSTIALACRVVRVEHDPDDPATRAAALIITRCLTSSGFQQLQSVLNVAGRRLAG